MNEAEQRLAAFVAKKRHQSNRQLGVANSKMGDQSDEQTDLEGIGAEIAFCKLHNVYPDLDTDGGHPSADAWTLALGAVDVKATTFTTGRLLARPNKINCEKVDHYVLMVGVFPTYKYVGSATAVDLLHPDQLTNLGHGPVYALNQAQLKQK